MSKGFKTSVQRHNSLSTVRFGTKSVGRRLPLSVANENQQGGGNDENGNPQGTLGEDTRRSLWSFLGAGAAGSAILIDIAALALAIAGAQEFVNSALPVAFLAFTLAVVGYFLGARMLAVGAIVFTVVALAVSAVVLQGL
jgi:hypothetical protein